MNKYLKVAYHVSFTSAAAILSYLLFASLTGISVPNEWFIILLLTPIAQLSSCMVGSKLMGEI